MLAERAFSQLASVTKSSVKLGVGAMRGDETLDRGLDAITLEF
jgi:hypothetical protein